MRMSFGEHGVWESNAVGDYGPSYPGELSGYSSLWEPHHCLGGQNGPPLATYPDILTAFNSDLVWPRHIGTHHGSSRLHRAVVASGHHQHLSGALVPTSTAGGTSALNLPGAIQSPSDPSTPSTGNISSSTSRCVTSGGHYTNGSHHHHQHGHHREGGSARGSSSSSKKTRRRVATVAQRRAANIRERRRMFNLNEAFDKLRRKVPTFAYEKRLSRIETLRLAITYISFMSELLHGQVSDRKIANDMYPNREYIPYHPLIN